MKVHIRDVTTGKTYCGKGLARRYWVEDTHVEGGQLGPLRVHRVVEPGANCQDCWTQRKPKRLAEVL